MQGTRSTGQGLQKLYYLLVCTTIYVTPVTNNPLQGMHVLVQDILVRLIRAENAHCEGGEVTAQSIKAALGSPLQGHSRQHSRHCQEKSRGNPGLCDPDPWWCFEAVLKPESSVQGGALSPHTWAARRRRPRCLLPTLGCLSSWPAVAAAHP